MQLMSRGVVLAVLVSGCHAGSLAPDGGMAVDAAAGMMPGGMSFAVFGDARPAKPGDTKNYPSAIVAGNFAQMQAKGAQFAVGTGDYFFANYEADVSAQL